MPPIRNLGRGSVGVGTGGRRRVGGGRMISNSIIAPCCALVMLSYLAMCRNSLLPFQNDDRYSSSSSSSSLRIALWRIRLGREVPSCPSHPWKADETMRGDCRSELVPKRRNHGGDTATMDTIGDTPSSSSSSLSIDECAISCCSDPECITWQHRRDVGCYHGRDVRIGMEKDGPSSWCSDHAPRRWQGQSLQQKNGIVGGMNEEYDDMARRMACDVTTWNPNEEIGQCFGLGDVRPLSSGSSVECMTACCIDPTCMGWQWNGVVSVVHCLDPDW